MQDAFPPGVAPAGAQAAVPPDAPRRGPLATVANVILSLDLAFLALVTVLAAVAAFAGGLQGASPAPAPPMTRRDIAVNTALSFALFGLVPILWLLATRVRPVLGTLAYLRLFRPGPSILQGVGVGALCVAGLFALGILFHLLGWTPENPVGDQLVSTVDWPLAVLLSLAAGVGEEVLFRGLLQRWLGVLPQAALFALSHAGYGVPLQIAIPGLLGLLLGLLVSRGASLWLAIAAHFTYDFLQFAIVLAWGDA